MLGTAKSGVFFLSNEIGMTVNLHISILAWEWAVLFELWYWRRLLRISWTARRSNHSILKEINTEYSLEGLMLKLKGQSFGHLMWGANSLEKTLMLEKIEDRRRRGQQRMRWMDGIPDSTDVSVSKLRETVRDWKAEHAAVYGVTASWTQLSDGTEPMRGKCVSQQPISFLQSEFHSGIFRVEGQHLTLPTP